MLGDIHVFTHDHAINNQGKNIQTRADFTIFGIRVQRSEMAKGIPPVESDERGG